MMLHGKALDLGLKPLARFHPRFGPRHALRAILVACQLAQFFEIRDGLFGVKTHVFASVEHCSGQLDEAAIGLVDLEDGRRGSVRI